MALGLYFRACGTLTPFFGRYSYHCRTYIHVHSKSCRDQALRACTHAFALRTEELDRRRLSDWRLQVAADSHQLCAKLWNHHSGRWEHIITYLLPQLLNDRVFSLPGACLAAITCMVLFSKLARGYQVYRFVQYRQNVILCYTIACVVAYPSACILKLATIWSYVHALAIAFFKLQCPGGSLSPILIMYSLCGGGEEVKVQLQALRAGSFHEQYG